jgi:hypothetical protein
MSHALDHGAQITGEACPVSDACPEAGAYWSFVWALTEKELTVISAAITATTVATKMMRFTSPPSFYSCKRSKDVKDTVPNVSKKTMRMIEGPPRMLSHKGPFVRHLPSPFRRLALLSYNLGFTHYGLYLFVLAEVEFMRRMHESRPQKPSILSITRSK